MNDFDTSEVEFDSRDGGYYFGTHIAPRVFELPCFYEDIDNRTKEKLVQWLDPRKSGTLVFDERPYAKYEVVPTKKIEFREYGHYDETGNLRRSATFTITLTAYSPFAELDLTGTDPITTEYKNEWILPDGALPSAPSPEATQFVVYNPGTEKADTIIRIAGASGDKMTIRNAATEQECTIMGMTRGNTTDANKWIEIDSATGQVWLVGAATRELSFVFHDDGYIQNCTVLTIHRSQHQLYHQQQNHYQYGRCLYGRYGWTVHLSRWELEIHWSSDGQQDCCAECGDG